MEDIPNLFFFIYLFRLYYSKLCTCIIDRACQILLADVMYPMLWFCSILIFTKQI